MVDIESLLIGFALGLASSIISIYIQHRKSLDILKIQLFHGDREKAYLELWEINKNHKGIELANEIENFLKSPYKIYLGDTEPKLREKVAFIREKYKKVHSLEVERGGKIGEAMGYNEVYYRYLENLGMEAQIEMLKEEQRKIAYMHPVEKIGYDYNKKIENAKNEFDMETKDINSDIFDLIEKKMKKLK